MWYMCTMRSTSAAGRDLVLSGFLPGGSNENFSIVSHYYSCLCFLVSFSGLTLKPHLLPGIQRESVYELEVRVFTERK